MTVGYLEQIVTLQKTCINWLITLIGNIIGCMIMLILVYHADIFPDNDFAYDISNLDNNTSQT